MKEYNYLLMDLDGTITDPMIGITRCRICVEPFRHTSQGPSGALPFYRASPLGFIPGILPFYG